MSSAKRSLHQIVPRRASGDWNPFHTRTDIAAWGCRLQTAVALAALVASGCGVGSRTRGYPLHGDANTPLSAVARLHGYVEEVDGDNVTEHGNLYELLPGCHVIGTPRTWGGAGVDASATAETGHLRFVIKMRAGHDYEVRVLMLEALHRIEVETVEKDPNGDVVAKHLPVHPVSKCP